MAGSGWTMCYGELDLRVSAAGERLRELGCEPGNRVALYMPRSDRYVVLLLALVQAGFVACPLSTRWPPQSLTPLLERVGCRALISDEETPEGSLPSGVRRLYPEELDGPPERDADLASPILLPLDRPATVVFTSGSSGGPKAALHTFGNHYYSARGSNANIALSPGDRWLLSLPLYHVGGLSILFRCLLAGATIALPESGASLSEAIRATGATHVSLVATQLRRLLEEGNELPGLKAALLGGGPTPEPLLEEALGRGLPIHTSYGLTEMASQVTTTPPGASPEKLRTAGRVLPHREVRVSPEGEILVRGETLFAGYVEGEVLDRPLDEDGWFHTRDRGDLDGDGYLRVRGRGDNLFISGGENIQPEEIEEALCRLEGVERAVVAPVPDEEFGERPVAFVRTEEAGGVRRDLEKALDETLPRFMVPVAFYEWPPDADPEKTKVDRVFFRERALRLHQKESGS
jgi:O-succinylbenzoic acid--CoA ligase